MGNATRLCFFLFWLFVAPSFVLEYKQQEKCPLVFDELCVELNVRGMAMITGDLSEIQFFFLRKYLHTRHIVSIVSMIDCQSILTFLAF